MRITRAGHLVFDVDRGGREGASRREARRVVLARQPADHRHAREERQGRAKDGDDEGLAPHLRHLCHHTRQERGACRGEARRGGEGCVGGAVWAQGEGNNHLVEVDVHAALEDRERDADVADEGPDVDDRAPSPVASLGPARPARPPEPRDLGAILAARPGGGPSAARSGGPSGPRRVALEPPVDPRVAGACWRWSKGTWVPSGGGAQAHEEGAELWRGSSGVGTRREERPVGLESRHAIGRWRTDAGTGSLRHGRAPSDAYGTMSRSCGPITMPTSR